MSNTHYLGHRTIKHVTLPLLIGSIPSPFAPVNSAWAGEVAGVTARAPTGVVEGRISSQSTGEFLHNAEVRVQGTEIIACGFFAATDGGIHRASYSLTGGGSSNDRGGGNNGQDRM